MSDLDIRLRLDLEIQRADHAMRYEESDECVVALRAALSHAEVWRHRTDQRSQRSLPIIMTCGDCGWFRPDDCSCRRSELGYVAKTEAPPAGCWLRSRP